MVTKDINRQASRSSESKSGENKKTEKRLKGLVGAKSFKYQ